MNFKNLLLFWMTLAAKASENQPVMGKITIIESNNPQNVDVPTLFNTVTDETSTLRGGRLLHEETKIQCQTATLGHDAVADCSVLQLPNHRILLNSENSGVLKIDKTFGTQNIKSSKQKKDKTGFYNVVETKEDGAESDAIIIISEDGRMVVRATEAAKDGNAAYRVMIQPCPVGEDNSCYVKLILNEKILSETEKKEMADTVELTEGRVLSENNKAAEDRDLAEAPLTELTMQMVFDTDSAKAIGANNLQGRARLAVELFNKIAKNSGIEDKVVMVLQEAKAANYKGQYDSYYSLMQHRESDRGGADISMFVSFDLSSCGRAFLRCSAVGDDVLDSCPYGVLKYSCLEYSFAHETGHILGANHNKEEFSPQNFYKDAFGIIAVKGPNGARSQLAYAYDSEPRKDIYSVGENAPQFEGFKMGSATANNARVIALEAPVFKKRLEELVGPRQPTRRPTERATEVTTKQPTSRSTDKPTSKPVAAQTDKPTFRPTDKPITKNPTLKPTIKPTDTVTYPDFCPSEIAMTDNYFSPIAQQLFATPTSANKNSFSFAVRTKQNSPAFVRLILEREFGGPIDIAFGEKNLMPNSDTVDFKNVQIESGDTFEVKYTTADEAIITIRNSDGVPKRAFVLASNGFEYSGYAKIASANVRQLNDVTCDYTGIAEIPVTQAPTSYTLPETTKPVFNSDIKFEVSSTPRTVSVARGGQMDAILWMKISSPNGADVSYIGFSGKYGIVTKQGEDIVTSESSLVSLNKMLSPQSDIYDLSEQIRSILADIGKPQITQSIGPGKTLRINVKNLQTSKDQTLILRGIKPGYLVEFGADQKSNAKVAYTVDPVPTKSPTVAPLKYSTFHTYIETVVLKDPLLSYNYKSLPKTALTNTAQYMPDIYKQMFDESMIETKPIRDFVDNKLLPKVQKEYQELNEFIQSAIDSESGYKWFGMKAKDFNPSKEIFKQYMAKIMRTAFVAKNDDNLGKVVLGLFGSEQDNTAEFLDAIKTDSVLNSLMNTNLKTLTEPFAKESLVQEIAVRLNKLFVSVTNHVLDIEKQGADLDRIAKEGENTATLAPTTNTPPDLTSSAAPRATFFAYDLAKNLGETIGRVVFGQPEDDTETKKKSPKS